MKFRSFINEKTKYNDYYIIKHTYQPYKRIVHNWNTFKIYANNDIEAYLKVIKIIKKDYPMNVFRIFKVDQENKIEKEIKYPQDVPHFLYHEPDNLEAIAYTIDTKLTNENIELPIDKFSQFYNELIKEMEKAGWTQFQGDNDPYSNIIKKFTRKGLCLLPDVIELNLYTAILNARISHRTIKNVELEDLDQLKQIITNNGGFIKKETLEYLKSTFKEFGKVKYIKDLTFKLILNKDKFTKNDLENISEIALKDLDKIDGITWIDASSYDDEVVLSDKTIEEILNSGNLELEFTLY